jgi:hypothetical protein
MGSNFAPLPELVKLRAKYGFLLIVDDVSILSHLLRTLLFNHEGVLLATKLCLQIKSFLSRLMEHLCMARMVVAHLSCLDAKMTLI